MAGLIYEVNIPQQGLTPGPAAVVAFLTAPQNHRVKLKAYGFFFDGTANSAVPIQIQLCRPAAIGTLAQINTAQLTEQGLPETPLSLYGVSASVQPTIANVYKTITVHPQLGYEYIAPLGEEEQIAGGQTWVASATALQPVGLRGYFRVEE